VFDGMGYTRLDSTLLAHESVLEAYFSTTLFASTGLALVLVGAFHAALARIPVEGTVDTTSCIGRVAAVAGTALRALRRTFALSRAAEATFPRVRLLYLLQLFTQCFVCLAALVTIAVRSTYTEASPLGFRIKFLGSETWTLRFQVMAVQTITLPLLALCWYAYIHFPAVAHSSAWARFLVSARPRHVPSAREKASSDRDGQGIELKVRET